MAEKEKKESKVKVTQDNFIFWVIGIAAVLIGGWGWVAENILQYTELGSWWPVIVLILCVVGYGLGVVMNSDTGRGVMLLVLIVIGLLILGLGVDLISRFLGTLIGLFIAIGDMFGRLGQAFRDFANVIIEFGNSLKVIAEYRPEVAMPVFGGLHLVVEVGIIVFLTAFSILLWVKIMNPRSPENGGDEKKIALTIKWLIFWIWAAYAAYRGVFSTLVLYLLAYALIRFGPKLFALLSGKVTVKAIDILERKGWKKLVSFMTTMTIVWAVLITGIIGYWFVIVFSVFSDNPILSIVIGCSGIAIATLHKK